MRPRGIPRGKRLLSGPANRRRHASMRPRGIPRGKQRSPRSPSRPQLGFNEAAGNTPRKTPGRSGRRCWRQRFNEAAGNTPRKTRSGSSSRMAWSRFNEAAGNTPRKTARRLVFVPQHRLASMRPRGIPRGKQPLPRSLARASVASMRPRGIPRGKLAIAHFSGGSKTGFNEAAGNTPRKTSYLR